MTAGPPIGVREAPEPGVLDLKAPAAAAADANAAVPLDRLLPQGLLQRQRAALALLRFSGEPRGHADHGAPGELPELYGCGVGVGQAGVAAAVMGQDDIPFFGTEEGQRYPDND